MKRFLSLLLAGAALCSLAGCGKKYKDLSAIQKKGEIVMFTDARWAPFEYVGEAGKEEGVDVDIARAIAEDLNVGLRIINADFDGFSLAVQNGQADIAIAAITITAERAETLDFSIPYTNSCQYILKQEADTALRSLNDLAGLRVGVHLGTTGDFLVSEQITGGVLAGTGAEVVQYKSLQEAALALMKGDLGALVCDDLLAKNLAAVNRGLTCFEARFADGTITEEFYGVAVAKGNTALLEAVNASLKKQMENGSIARSLDYHIMNSSLIEE
ncbi:MAG: transporter substrate-binding domain-containing protein [Spirochaetaceae bacterium]|jgi:polar amino acid transport system substrate-binding protein|nr:transporter substrate-binding domain-containing protein [Spirochaetaceae bacterium]